MYLLYIQPTFTKHRLYDENSLDTGKWQQVAENVITFVVLIGWADFFYVL